jgi:hypothetical protein
MQIFAIALLIFVSSILSAGVRKVDIVLKEIKKADLGYTIVYLTTTGKADIPRPKVKNLHGKNEKTSNLHRKRS